MLHYKRVTSAEEAFEAVKHAITPELLSKYKVKPDIRYNESDLSVTAKGKGFELNLFCLEQGIDYRLDLSLVLRPLKGKIMGSIEKKIGQIL
jgi:hypothetical protein